MANTKTKGRETEVTEIVRHRRAAEVGRLLLGELHQPLTEIIPENYLSKPRAEIKTELASIKRHLKGELAKFCRTNFESLEPADLARLYMPLFDNNSKYRIALSEFEAQYGKPKDSVLRGAPRHATICISPWGLQTEYPEMHLSKDLAISFNDAVGLQEKIDSYSGTSWQKAKENETRATVAELQRRAAYSRRMCLLSCFNLCEAYINGLAWDFVHSTDISVLSNKKQKLLTDSQASLLEKLEKIPPLIAGNEHGPLSVQQNPLSEFKDLIKPFRDSIVHASPFGAAERFGGYDKLSRVYALNAETAKRAIELTLSIIGTIHRYLGRKGDFPLWCPRQVTGGMLELPQ